MDNTNEWGAWWWANEKMKQGSFIAKKRPRRNPQLIK
jgi:hypothetical protein